MTSLLGQQPCSLKPVDAAPVRQQKSVQTLPFASQRCNKVNILCLSVLFQLVLKFSSDFVLHSIAYLSLLAEIQQPETEKEHGCHCRGEILAMLTCKFKFQSVFHLLHVSGLQRSISSHSQVFQ